MDMQALDYKELARQLLTQSLVTQKDVPSSTPNAGLGHGPGGLFSAPGLERPVFSTLILPNLGLLSRLPAFGNSFTNPLYGIMTGVTGTTGSEPTGVCDDPPYAGLSKLCEHQFVFGRLSRMTRVIDIDTAGKRYNRSDNTDLRLMNNPLATPGQALTPTLPSGDVGQMVNNEIAKNLFEFAVSWARDFAGLLYTGNPTNNTAGGGYKEWYGLDILINTGYRDAETGVACPAADSIVRSAANREISSNGAWYVRNITNIMRNLQFISRTTRLNPVKWVISMRWNTFYELTEIWPCAYYTYRCSNDFSASQVNSIDAQAMIDLRDNMRGNFDTMTGQYLLIDGAKVEVQIDDTIAETQVAGGSFRSPIYFVPMTVLGGTPVTFWEYFDYNGPNGSMEMARLVAPQDSYFVTDGGRFMWHKKPPNNFCVQMLCKTEPRVLLLTPMIAARLTDVQATPVAHERDWLVNASFYVDGGKTERDYYGPSYYSPNS